MIEGLSHITLIVRDLAWTGRMFETVLDGKEVYRSGVKQFSIAPERFYEVGGLWIAIMQHQIHATRTYDNVAFKIADRNYDLYRRRILDFGLELRESRLRIEGEGRSLYFHDEDNHLFELHTGTLATRLAAYAGSAGG
jgi:catechol 2,3-dioxygenase-like lactoylglutathione lyase family enzyme